MADNPQAEAPVRDVVVLAGGVGAARFLEGVVRAVDPARVTAIVNTGDDAEFYGLTVSPDVDIVLFTLAGSMLTFLGLLAIVLWDYQTNGEHTLRFSIPALTRGLAEHPMTFNWQMLVFLALFAGFAIKVPLFPLHTWLPLAHVQAPTAGSVAGGVGVSMVSVAGS